MPELMGVNDIAFPHLGIYLENVPKIVFSIFGFSVAYYGLVIGIGVLLGVLTAVQMAKKENLNPDIVWDFAIYAVIFSVIGARIYYVIFSWDLYKNDLLSIFNTRQGGMAIYGGVIAAFITLFVYCRIKKISPFQLGDCCVCGLLVGQIIGRWGNFFNREVFGEYTDSLFAMRLPVEAVRAGDISKKQLEMMQAMENVNYIQAHPTFLYEGLWNLGVLLIILLFHSKKKYNGQICLMYLGGYGIGRFFIEGIRTDQLKFAHTQIPVSQALGMVMFVCALALHVFIIIKNKKKVNV